MANYKVVDADELDSKLKSLADATRERNNTTDEIPLDDMARQIKEGSERHVDTSTIDDWSYYFYNGARFSTFTRCDMSKGKNYDSVFYNCKELIDCGVIDMRNIIKDGAVNKCRYLFSGCSNLVSAKLMVNSLESANLQRAFYNASGLVNLVIEGTIKVNSNDLNVAYSPKLSVESLVSILEALEDNTGEDTKYTVYFGSTNLAKLTPEQEVIATNKNIDLS